MNEIEKYQRYMRFKSHFKNIPIISPLVRLVKWKYYRPLIIKRFKRERFADYEEKVKGLTPWTENEKALISLKDAHKGEIAFIVGNGPSLRAEDLSKLMEKGVFCFAMNRIHFIFDRTEWRPDCYMAIDRQIYREGDSTIPSLIKEKLPLYILSKGAYEGIPEELLSDKILYINTAPNSHYLPVDEFSDNAMVYVVDGFTVTYCAMQMAYFMGFKKVYLLGVDFDYSRTIGKDGKVRVENNSMTYFDKRYDSKNVNAGYMEGMLQGYETAQKFCEMHDFKILNATRGGKLDVFERVDFDTILESLA